MFLTTRESDGNFPGQKGCSLRKGDVLNQTSCSRPRHVEGHRQWELGTGKQDLTTQLHFPSQRSLLSACQPNKWTWQICYIKNLYPTKAPCLGGVFLTTRESDGNFPGQKGCSLRKGDVLNQTSCSRPRHVESQRQWELATGKRDLAMQLYFPAQGSLLSASQPNKWTWQICYI